MYPNIIDVAFPDEEFVKEHSGEFSKKQLWENLPRKTMYQTFSTILDYLEYSKRMLSIHPEVQHSKHVDALQLLFFLYQTYN
jgi:hypothetical protein